MTNHCRDNFMFNNQWTSNFFVQTIFSMTILWTWQFYVLTIYETRLFRQFIARHWLHPDQQHQNSTETKDNSSKGNWIWRSETASYDFGEWLSFMVSMTSVSARVNVIFKFFCQISVFYCCFWISVTSLS